MAFVPPLTDVPFPNDDVPLPSAALITLLGDNFQQARWLAATRVALRSRNRLYRIHLTDAPQASVILKLVREQDDIFWQHHLRREHWLLELLQRFWPGGAPRPYALVIGHGWGLLMMEDVGDVSLAEALGGSARAAAERPRQEARTESTDSPVASGGDDPVETNATAQVALLAPVLDRLADLHRTLAAQERIFRRVCQSIDLDRITAPSLLARARVSQARLREDTLSGAGRLPLTAGSVRAYADQVIRPLMTGPRQMIHNSLSPLNVVLGPTLRLVDWETMALAPPEFDIADLLRYPGIRVPWRTLDHLVGQAFGSQVDLTRLRLAALARTVDYAGSNAHQVLRSREAGDDANAVTAGGRRDWYLAEARTLAGDLGVASTMHDLIG